MKYILALVALVGLAQARPQEPVVTILRNDLEHRDDGSFNYAWETSDGSKSEQSGHLINPAAGEESGIAMQGAYSYYSPEGTLISVQYVADEGGFQPQVSGLPTPPPVPEEIQRAVELLLRNAEIQRQAAASENHEVRVPAPQTFRQQPQRRF